MEGEEDEGGWGSEFEDENIGQEDDDDTSWKVRRASIKTIDVIISSRPELLRQLYQRYAKKLVDRFKERDDNVKCNILDSFQTLLKSTIIQESGHTLDLELSHQPSLMRQRSSTDELAELVPMIVDSLLKQLKSKNLKVRVSVMATMSQLAHCLHEKLEPYFPKMIPDFEKNLNETSSYDLILDTLSVMRRMFRSKSQSKQRSTVFTEHFKKIMEFIMKALGHEYSKVVSEGLRVAGSFVHVLRGADGNTIDERFAGDVVNQMYKGVFQKLAKTDIDQEVKQCSIIAMASIITVCHNKL